MKFFEVSVEIKLESEDLKGGVKIKKVKENYLVDAMTVTEAEARVVKLFSDSGYSQDYEVVGVRGSKIVEVILPDTKKVVVKKENSLPKEQEEEL